MAVKEFKRVSYKELQDSIHEKRTKKKISDFELAMRLGGKSSQTVRNALNVTEHIASDKLLTQLMKAVGVNGKVEWIEGVRYYSIKN
jgi:hypothetical protein